MSNSNRPPLSGNSLPPSGPPQAVDNPCIYLPQLRAALYAAMTGNATQQTRDGERWRTTHNPNVKELRAEVRKLEILCDPRMARRAVRAGPFVPPGAINPGYGFPFGYGWPF